MILLPLHKYKRLLHKREKTEANDKHTFLYGNGGGKTTVDGEKGKLGPPGTLEKKVEKKTRWILFK